MNNQYEIQSSAKSNVNAYNRYPFSCYSEAVNNLLKKSLLPGELAVAYYFDDSTVIGINAVFAFGNLKLAGNIIFNNSEQINQDIQHNGKSISKLKEVCNHLVDAINGANKHWSSIEQRLKTLEELFKETHNVKYIKMLDLDSYEVDLM